MPKTMKDIISEVEHNEGMQKVIVKDLLTLISECVLKKERLGLTKEVRAFFKGFNNCRSQFLKNISERSGISEDKTKSPKKEM